VIDRLQLELNLNPVYIWGAAGLAPGAPGDCSGKLYAILASCGFPVQRVPVSYIARRQAGWCFPFIAYAEGKSLALVIMTTQAHRKHGHIGMLRTDVQWGKIAKMAHASSRLGFTQVVLAPGQPMYKYVDFLMQVRNE